MGINKLIISFGMLILFAIAIVSYSISFGTDNDSVVNLNQDSEFTGLQTDLNSEVSSFQSVSNSSSNIFQGSDIKSGDSNVGGEGIFKTIATLSSGMKTIFSSINKTIFGKNGSEFSIVITIIVSIIILITTLYGWKAIRSGEVD